MTKAKDVLLQAVHHDKHKNRSIPSHVELRVVRDDFGNKGNTLIDVIDPAASSIDLAILKLAVDGEISPQQLIEIYPDQQSLRRYLVTTMEAFIPVEKDFADRLNDLMLLKMLAVGWDQ